MNIKNSKTRIALYKLKKKLKKIIKVIFIVLLLLIVVFIFLKEKHTKDILNIVNNSYKKQLYKINYNICNKLLINGVKYSNLEQIKQSINEYCFNSDVSIYKLKENILKDPWIKELYIRKKFPDSLIVNIIEHNPFAIATIDNKNYKLIDEYGDVINVDQGVVRSFSYLLIIVGDNFNNEINDLFNILSIYYNIAKRLIKIERVGNRRWNLVLKNNIVIKMPEEDENIFDIWTLLDKILNIYGFDIDLEEIDLRVKDRIFLKYKNNIAEEIRNI